MFSRSLFKRLLKRNEVINMNLKGWPFEPLGDTEVDPCGGIGNGPGTGPPQ